MRRELVSRPFRRDQLDELYERAQEGDLLEFRRPGFSHWAVYVGLEEYQGRILPCVIHRSLPLEEELSSQPLFRLASRSCKSSASVIDSRFGCIQLDSVEVTLGSNPKDVVVINNELDLKWTPYPSEQIVATAKKLMNDEIQEPYNLLKNNCEHFAMICRYGRKYSRQIAKGVVKVVSTAAGMMASMAGRSVWKAVAAPALLSAAGAVGITLGPVAVAAIGAIPTIAGVVASAAPGVAHVIESHRGRRNP